MFAIRHIELKIVIIIKYLQMKKTLVLNNS